jgi:predicted DNA-binding transcriptional regulator YafY
MNMLGELNELPDEDDNDETIAPMPSEEDNIFPGDNSRFIKNTVLLDYAIREKLQVEITYGIYDVYENGIDYHHRMENGKNKIYRLNPYALFWGDGHYYLLATYVSGYEPPYMKEKDTNINFRVDRIIDVRIVKEKGAVCEKIPKRLKNFFDTEGIFDDVSYSARFPGMRISEHSNMIDCIIECTPWSLQILVDTFGTLIEVSESRREHKKNEVDYNGRKQKFLEVKIKQVEFENIRDYCLSHPEYITPVEPKELVMAVKDKLTECLKKLEY